MNKTSLFFLFCFLFSYYGIAQTPQNLVVNPTLGEVFSFQTNSAWSGESCDPIANSFFCYKVEEMTGYYSYTHYCPIGWQSATYGTADYFHHTLCNWHNYPEPIYPYSGIGFMVFYNYYPPPMVSKAREYIQGHLLSPLDSQVEYCAGVYVILDTYRPPAMIYATSSLGVHLSDTAIWKNTWLPFTEYQPQIENPPDNFLTDSVNWMLITGRFIAQGGEQYITIGNFNDNDNTPILQFKENNTTYPPAGGYSICFVFVFDCTDHFYACDAGADVSICHGDSAQIGTDNFEDYRYQWFPAEGLNNPKSGRPVASPQQTTTYYLSVTDNHHQPSVDSVTVTVIQCEHNNSDLFVPNIFSPNGDGENDVLFVRGASVISFEFVVYNRWGQKVFESNDKNHSWDGTFNGSEASVGVYVYHLKAVTHEYKTIIKHGDVTLVR